LDITQKAESIHESAAKWRKLLKAGDKK